MPIKPFPSCFGFTLLVPCILLFSCGGLIGDPPPDPLGVTPNNTPASTLKVTINIIEDQDAADQQSSIQFWFQTDLIQENNYLTLCRIESGRFLVQPGGSLASVTRFEWRPPVPKRCPHAG